MSTSKCQSQARDIQIEQQLNFETQLEQKFESHNICFLSTAAYRLSGTWVKIKYFGRPLTARLVFKKRVQIFINDGFLFKGIENHVMQIDKFVGFHARQKYVVLWEHFDGAFEDC